MYQGQVGGDFNNSSAATLAGDLSLDAIGQLRQERGQPQHLHRQLAPTSTKGPFAGQTGCYSGIPMFYSNNDLRRRCRTTPAYVRASTNGSPGPSPAGTHGSSRRIRAALSPTASRPSAAGTFPRPSLRPSRTLKKLWPTQWISYTTYADPRIAPFWFIGAKYAITPQLDVTGAFYYLQPERLQLLDHALRHPPTPLRRTKRE